MSEQLKYYSQIKEYWLNKNDCLNIVKAFSVKSPRLMLLMETIKNNVIETT